MKRFSDQHVLDIAQRFADSRWASVWMLFGEDIRGAIIDSIIMTEMRIADCADSKLTFTATDVIDLRERVVAALSAGVRPKLSRRPMVRYLVEP